MQDGINYVKQHAAIYRIRDMYERFQKATEGMNSDARNTYIDHHILNYVHHLIHEVEDSAKEHFTRTQQTKSHEEDIRRMREEQEGLRGKVVKLLSKLVNDFGSHRVSSPEDMPQIPHMAEYHDVVPEMMRKIMAGKISKEDAADQIINSIDGEIEHDSTDVTSSVYNKADVELFAKSFDPFHYIGVQGNALSMYRPSPTFMLTQYEKPDEAYVRMMAKLKQPDIMKYRVPVPKENIEEVIEGLGMPEYRPLDQIRQQEREMRRRQKEQEQQAAMQQQMAPQEATGTEEQPEEQPEEVA